MSKYKQYRLISYYELLKRYEGYIQTVNDKVIINKEFMWCIDESSIRRFGGVVKAKRIREEDYVYTRNFTHVDIDGYHLYHEFWFKFKDFIDEKEMLI